MCGLWYNNKIKQFNRSTRCFILTMQRLNNVISLVFKNHICPLTVLMPLGAEKAAISADRAAP